MALCDKKTRHWYVAQLIVRCTLDIENIQIIPIEASDPKNLIRDLKKIFESEEAADAKSVVYFFLSKHPIPRLKSESKILYIGKTINTLKQRWLPNVEKLNSKKSSVLRAHYPLLRRTSGRLHPQRRSTSRREGCIQKIHGNSFRVSTKIKSRVAHLTMRSNHSLRSLRLTKEQKGTDLFIAK